MYIYIEREREMISTRTCMSVSRRVSAASTAARCESLSSIWLMSARALTRASSVASPVGALESCATYVRKTRGRNKNHIGFLVKYIHIQFSGKCAKEGWNP